MDRFKEFNDIMPLCLVLLYIPVWIDLKPPSLSTSVSISKLYIPVWIDLKKQSRQNTIHKARLYIPVWIDLKNCNDFL